mmetsp:Transcript_7781/g.13096  ORF Transcript_7781/g.13096 Transcript_7781/m.13096 type:complete len:296 (-) Transcript_7781:65-952(-)
MSSFTEKAKEGVQPEPELSATKKHFLKLNETIERLSSPGSVLIVGIKKEGDDEDDDEYDDEEEEDDEIDEEESYTEEQINNLRHIIITENREKEFERNTRKFGASFGNTHTGNCTIYQIPQSIRKYLKMPTLSETFDGLFAMTYALHNFDSWMYDNEEWGPGGKCDKAICSLAKAWRELLAHSDEELDIDTEFTRPGIEKLLEKFKESVAAIPDQSCYKFNFDGSYDGEDEDEEDAEDNENDDASGAEEEDDEDSDEDDDDEIDIDEIQAQVLLDRAMEAYRSVNVVIPDDSDSD